MKPTRTFFAHLLALTALLATLPGLANEAAPTNANITYQGTYAGVAVSGSARKSREDEMSGAVTLSVIFEGPAVRAKATTTGTIRSFEVTGSRVGTECKLFNRRGDSLEGTCTQTAFNAILKSRDNARKQYDVQFQSTATSVVDIDERTRVAAEQRAAREKQRVEEMARIQREQQAAAEVRKREEDAERARLEKILQNLPPAKK
jgi:hypothetical protein